MRIEKIFVTVAVLALSGCATMVDGPNQYITINSGPVHYAHCVLSRPGERFNVTTPGSIHISKSEDDLNIRCSRPGSADAVATIPSQINPWVLGNLALGAAPVLVDGWTGAAFEYPATFDLPMSPGMAQPDAVPTPYTAPSAPVQATMPAPAPAPTGGKPLPGTLPDNF